MSNIPFSTDTVTTNTDLVGEEFCGEDGKWYRVVKTSASIAAAVKKTVVWVDEAAFTVNVSTTADDDTVAGVIPATLTTISATSGTLDSGDVVAIQTAGMATCLNANAIAANAPVGTSTTAGSIDDLNITFGGNMGRATDAASTTAGADVTVFLKNLR